MSARENILQKLRGAQSAQVAFEHATIEYVDTKTGHTQSSAPNSLPTRETDRAALRESFIGNLEANHAQIVPTSRECLAEDIRSTIAQLNLGSLMASPQTTTLLSSTSEQAPADFPEICNWPAAPDTKSVLFNQTDAALTLSAGAIAETGSILLIPNENEPRSLSLIPPTHLVIVEEEKIYPNLSGYFASPAFPETMPTNLVLVSGPSKTADIQQTLAYGAHGPARLVVFLVAESDRR